MPPGLDPNGHHELPDTDWWEFEELDPDPPYEPGWLRSRGVRTVVVVVVAIALAAFTVAWAFITLQRTEEPPPRTVIEVVRSVGTS